MAPVEEEKIPVSGQNRRAGFTVRNVLFTTDFSSISEAALPYAAAICRRFGGTLHAAHILSDTSLLMATGGIDYVSLGTMYESAQADAKQKLEQMAARCERIPHRIYIGHGPVWSCLENVIQQNEIDLIVMGTHGRTGLGRLVLGSVAENILRHAPCPVLTVGPKISGHAKLPMVPSDRRDLAPPELELQQIVFATNFERNAAQNTNVVVSLAESFEARVTLVHVIEDYTQLGSRPGPIEETVGRLQALVPKEAALQYAPETVVEFGRAAEEIVRTASEREADLIVLGARPAAEVGTTHLPWSTAHQVIAGAHCPVLTLRADGH